jgi:integrase/recombinase XerD
MHIKGGKGRKDRDVMLSLKLLEELREHWCRVGQPPPPRGSADQYENGLHACQNAAKRAGIQIGAHPHMLRHCFGTHLLEAGADLRTIQILMGHSDLKETTVYLHLSQRHLHATASPLDSLKLKDRSPQEK